MTVLLLSYPASWILTALINWSIFLFITKKMMQNMGTTALKEIQKLFICKSYLANIHKRPVSHTGLSDAITVPDRNDP